MPEEFKALLSQAILTSAFSLLSWIIADTRSKARLQYMEEKVAKLSSFSESAYNELNQHCSISEVSQAKSEQDRLELRRMIERLDSQKASKEVVDSFRSEVANLRFDMDKRFDRIERLIEGNGLNYKHNS